MGGEHFDSTNGKSLDKKKDTYVRFRWETKKNEKRPKQTILSKEKILENKIILWKWLGIQQIKKTDICVLCGEVEDWPLVRFEFYNFDVANTESSVFAHEKCLKKAKINDVIEGLRLMGKNPTFLLQLNCLSIDKCLFHKPAKGLRNCEHTVLRFDTVTEDNKDGTHSVNMRAVLYCKRAHPGEFYLETEEDTYWNVQEAGLAVMAQRYTELLNNVARSQDIQRFKMQNSGLIAEVRRMIAAGNPMLSLLSPQALAFMDIVAGPTTEEEWEIIQQGNDVY
jgi:hypothetical protein